MRRDLLALLGRERRERGRRDAEPHREVRPPEREGALTDARSIELIPSERARRRPQPIAEGVPLLADRARRLLQLFPDLPADGVLLVLAEVELFDERPGLGLPVVPAPF